MKKVFSYKNYIFKKVFQGQFLCPLSSGDRDTFPLMWLAMLLQPLYWLHGYNFPFYSGLGIVGRSGPLIIFFYIQFDVDRETAALSIFSDICSCCRQLLCLSVIFMMKFCLKENRLLLKLDPECGNLHTCNIWNKCCQNFSKVEFFSTP